MDLLCFSVLCLLCLCACLFIYASWSPAGKRLTLWLSFVVSNCEFVTFPLVSWVRCGTWLYRFLIFAPLLTLVENKKLIFDYSVLFWLWYIEDLARDDCGGFLYVLYETTIFWKYHVCGYTALKSKWVWPGNSTITHCRPRHREEETLNTKRHMPLKKQVKKSNQLSYPQWAR